MTQVSQDLPRADRPARTDAAVILQLIEALQKRISRRRHGRRLSSSVPIIRQSREASALKA